MTKTINIHQAKTHLSQLLQEVVAGEEIIIARSGKPVARLVPYQPILKERQPGSALGKIRVNEDFEAPLPNEQVDEFENAQTIP